MRPVAAGLVVLLLAGGCGGGGGGENLRLTSTDRVAVLDANLRWVGTSGLSLVGGDGEVAVVWAEPDSDLASRIVARTVRDMAVVDPEGDVSDSARAAHSASACRGGNAIAVAWTDEPRELPPGVTLDESNVSFVRDWPSQDTASQVNSRTLGLQRATSIACVADGGLVVAWQSFCTAVEVRGNTNVYFTPEECQDEPEDGAFLSFYDAEGEPVGSPVRLDGAAWLGHRVAGAGRGVLVVGGTRPQYIEDGVVVAEADDEGAGFGQSAPACVGSRCAVAADGRIVVFDVRDLDQRREAVFQETIDPAPNVSEGPRDARVACDVAGTCVVTWVLQRETWDDDVIFTESLGAFARAFDLESATLGEVLPLPGPPDEQAALPVASDGPGSFVFASARGDDVELRPLRVE